MSMPNKSDGSLYLRNRTWLEDRQPCGDAHPILIADDSEADIFFLLRAMNQSGVANPIHVVRDGKAALAYLKGSGVYADRAKYPVPGIVLLDLRMPGHDGFE